MPGSYSKPAGACRAFVVTPYLRGADGRLAAQIPACCPAQRPGCVLAIHHRRRRKTGPDHPLAVVRCKPHEWVFTLYPPAFAPYARQPVLRVSPSGQAIQQEGAPACTDFAGTIFDAALDAEAGRAWQREEGPAERWWGTQCRHLQLAARLVGVAALICANVRESIAMVLSVPTLQLHEGARACGYRAIGKAVCGVLANLRGGARRARQMLICGFLIGQWGEPLHWDADRGVLERSAFCCPGTRLGAELFPDSDLQRLGDMGASAGGS